MIPFLFPFSRGLLFPLVALDKTTNFAFFILIFRSLMSIPLSQVLNIYGTSFFVSAVNTRSSSHSNSRGLLPTFLCSSFHYNRKKEKPKDLMYTHFHFKFFWCACYCPHSRPCALTQSNDIQDCTLILSDTICISNAYLSCLGIPFNVLLRSIKYMIGYNLFLISLYLSSSCILKKITSYC